MAGERKRQLWPTVRWDLVRLAAIRDESDLERYRVCKIMDNNMASDTRRRVKEEECHISGARRARERRGDSRCRPTSVCGCVR